MLYGKSYSSATDSTPLVLQYRHDIFPVLTKATFATCAVRKHTIWKMILFLTHVNTPTAEPPDIWQSHQPEKSRGLPEAERSNLHWIFDSGRAGAHLEHPSPSPASAN